MPCAAGKHCFCHTACFHLGPQARHSNRTPTSVGFRVYDPYMPESLGTHLAVSFKPTTEFSMCFGVVLAKLPGVCFGLWYAVELPDTCLDHRHMFEFEVPDLRPPSTAEFPDICVGFLCMASAWPNLPWPFYDRGSSQDVIAAVLRCRFAPLPSWRPQARRLRTSVIQELQ